MKFKCLDCKKEFKEWQITEWLNDDGDEDDEDGMVLQIYQKGYMYKDKLLRPAMVIVNE